MRWERASKLHEKSIPGGLYVTQYRVLRDGELVWVYQAIRLGSPSVVLCEALDAASCKAACRSARAA